MVDDVPTHGDEAQPARPQGHRTLQLALELAAAGYFLAPVVIRRDPKTGKKLGDYLGIRWHDASTTDPAQLRDWFAEHQCSFLVDTGKSGVFAVDLDVPGDPRVSSGESVWNAAHLPLGSMVVRTPGGGYHHYFRARAGETLTVHKRIHGHPIDVRADGGHVYAPGAVILGPGDVPELRGYEIVQATSAPGGAIAPAAQLETVPEVVATFLHAERGAPARKATAQGEVRTVSQVRDACRSVLDRVSSSERRENSGFRGQLLGAGMVLGRAVAAGLMTEAGAATLLEQRVAMVWPTPNADDRRNIRHGLEDGQADPWTVVPDDWDTTLSTAAERDRGSSEAVSASKIDPPVASYNLSNGGTDESVTSGDGVGPAGSGTVDSAGALDGLAAELEESDSWAPVDLGPFLDGDVVPPAPSVGVVRTDGARILYAGLEHAVIGAMESGKSWFALACVAAELVAGRRCLYVHFEESSPRSTVERLRLFGVPAEVIRALLTFVGPERRISPTDVDRLLSPAPPSLVILDGQNEAMALHGQEIMAPEGPAEYRRRLVKPFTRAGAAVVSLDHVVKDREEAGSGIALGSVHKGNGLDGALILLENMSPFGRGRNGASMVSVTKDRPAALRQLGQQRDQRNPRKFFVGMMHVEAAPDVVDGWRFRFEPPGQIDAGEDPEFAAMRAERAAADVEADMRALVLAEVTRMNGERQEPSSEDVRVVMPAGKRNRTAVVVALGQLVKEGQLVVSTGGHGSKRYSLK